MKMKMVLGGLTVAMLMVGCSNNAAAPAGQAEAKPVFTEEELGLRKTDIYTEQSTMAVKTQYRADAPGTSQRIDRAFDNAPPMIPHDTEGMLPITKDNNMCTSCHMPEVASAMGATPIPKSHFADMRPHHKVVGGVFQKTADNMKNETALQVKDTLYNGRFNCSQCHAPQATGDTLVENTFRPDFQSEDMKHGSSLLDTLNTGVK